MQPRYRSSVVKLTAIVYPYLVWFTAKFIQYLIHSAKFISDFNTLSALKRNIPSTFAVNIEIALQKSDLLIVFTC